MSNTYLTKRNYAIAAGITAFALSSAAKYIVKKSYKKITGNEAPQNPEVKHADLKEVVLFSVGLALVSATVKTIGRKYFAKQWTALDGELPKHLS
ncbi:DUF4235 domain-containing protein [Fulvivirga sp. RKSG066]|uniref:DUF4235 domain-containing protein n=1 Tax=Fulvivirga aurantia TaxID=2529383 RepID=UPI0012BB8522|nr:DUF4235 domain-containing protein [Fulvivirga aurantia]MTI20994.1 DUF4235 domain-containing protein [Fulvivirga aurantia]